MPDFFHFRVNGRSSERHAEKEMQSEEERVVRGKPNGDGSVPRGKRNRHEREMSREQYSRRGRESCPSVSSRHLHDGSHDRDDRQSSQHVEGDVPERTVDFAWEERGRMRPAEERNSSKDPPKRVIHSSENREYRDQRKRERHVVGGRDAEEPVHERVLGVRSGSAFVDGPPIRCGPEHSS